MVRHSGFLTSFAAVLLAGLSVSILERRSDGSSEIQPEGRAATVFKVSENELFLSPLSPKVGSQPVPAIRFPVPANSLVIVGSLDVSGAAHPLVISSQSDEQQTGDTSSCSQDGVDLEYINTRSLPDMRRGFEPPKCSRPDRTTSEVSTKSEPSSAVRLLADEPSRRFLIPHFEYDHVVQQPCEASPLAEGSRVKVYVDLSMPHNRSDISQHQQMCVAATHVCETIECELLPQIESWIGAVTDLDEDQRLSVVLTDLDRRRSTAETPVLGCVRRGDFLADDQNSLAGDILYLDRHLPPREQLRALLAHELTHAAIFCIRHEAPNESPLKDHFVPSWLNEAAAHWVERQFCSAPAGYAVRESAFRQSPAVCPIMMNDDDHYLEARRTGSRVAGFTFLQQHLTDARDLRALLEQCRPFEQSVSAIAGAPFSQLFRQWTISQTCGDLNAFSPLHSNVRCCSLTTGHTEPVRRKVHGTAFLILKSEAKRLVSIEADSNAQLQITVMYQANLLSTQDSRDISATTGLQSAELKPLPRTEIQ